MLPVNQMGHPIPSAFEAASAGPPHRHHSLCASLLQTQGSGKFLKGHVQRSYSSGTEVLTPISDTPAQAVAISLPSQGTRLAVARDQKRKACQMRPGAALKQAWHAVSRNKILEPLHLQFPRKIKCQLSVLNEF